MTLTAYISILFLVHFETIFKRSKGPRTVYDELKKEKSDPPNPQSRNDYSQNGMLPQRLFTKWMLPQRLFTKWMLPQRFNTKSQIPQRFNTKSQIPQRFNTKSPNLGHLFTKYHQ